MEKRVKIIIIIGVVVFIILAIYLVFSRFSNPTGYIINGQVVHAGLDDFAMCLTSNGAKLYGAFWCSHCKEQKDLFSSSLQYLDYVECDANGENAQLEECARMGIEGYPTWIINNQKYPGTKSLEELARLTGCKLN